MATAHNSRKWLSFGGVARHPQTSLAWPDLPCIVLQVLQFIPRKSVDRSWYLLSVGNFIMRRVRSRSLYLAATLLLHQAQFELRVTMQPFQHLGWIVLVHEQVG
jgi:hypothetical protein